MTSPSKNNPCVEIPTVKPRHVRIVPGGYYATMSGNLVFKAIGPCPVAPGVFVNDGRPSYWNAIVVFDASSRKAVPYEWKVYVRTISTEESLCELVEVDALYAGLLYDQVIRLIEELKRDWDFAEGSCANEPPSRV